MYGQQHKGNERVGKGDFVRADVIYSYDLDDTLSILKKSALERGMKSSNEFYHACLDRLDIIITERNSVVGKDEVVRILRELSYFRPRDYDRADKFRKEAGNFTQSELQDDIISVRHKQLIKKNSEKYQTLPGHVFGFLSEHITTGVLKDMFTQFDEDQRSKLDKSLYDVMAIYIQVYQNLSVRVLDMLAQNLFNASEALDIMVSYSIAEEGSNTLYLKLIEVMLTRREEYNMVEIEMILNYFPHRVWSTEDQLKHLRDKFYAPIFDLISDNLYKMENRQFIGTFQGLCLCGSSIFKEQLLNAYLNQYVARIKSEDRLTTKQMYQFLEILIQYLQVNKQLMQNIDSGQIMRLSSDLYLKNTCVSMSPDQLSGLYWLCKNLGPFWDNELLSRMEMRLVELLEKEIQIQKELEGDLDAEVNEGLQTISLNELQVMENYYLVDDQLLQVSSRARQIQKLIKQCLYWDKPETERKWFHY